MAKIMKYRSIVCLVLGIIIGATGVFTPLAIASHKDVNTTVNYRDIKINIDGNPTELTDLEGRIQEPVMLFDTCYVPLSALARALGKPSEFDSSTYTIHIGERTDKPYKEIAVWDKPMIDKQSDVTTNSEAKDDFINFYGYDEVKYVVYPTNGKAKEIKGTFVGGGMDGKFNFYDENDNLLYTSPIISDSISGYDFSFQIKNISQIKIEAVGGSYWYAQVKNLRLVSTDY